MNVFFDNCLAVFQGGGCKALAYVGAYKSALKHGVHFNELAGTSAGSIVAALIAAGATPDQLEKFAYSIPYKKLFAPRPCSYIVSFLIVIISLPLVFVGLLLTFQFKSVKKLLKIQYIPLLRHIGMYNMKPLRTLLENELRRLTGKNDEVRFKDLIPNLHVVASDIHESKEVIWDKNSDPEKSVAEAVCASCAIPVFFQPIENRYVDGGILSNAPTHIFAKRPNYHKILSFQTENSTRIISTNLFGYIKQIISTIIDGAVSLQNTFGVEVYPIKINVNDIEATDFDKITHSKIAELIKSGSNSFDSFWTELEKNEVSDISVNALNKTINSYEEMYSLVATYTHMKLSEVYVSCSNTKWAWIMFPTLLQWIKNQTPVVVYAPTIPKEDQSKFAKEERTRRELLAGLGIPTREKDNPNVNGFFLQQKTKKTTLWRGVFYTEKSDPNNNQEKLFQEGCYYDHKLDGKAIEAWVGKLRNHNDVNVTKLKHFELELVNDDIIFSKFKDFPYYGNAKLEYKVVQLDKVLFLNHHIRLEKYRQISVLFDLYAEHNLDLFKATNLKLLGNKTNLIGPIVLEEHDNQLYVIEGNTRLAYAYYKKGMSEIYALVIKGIDAPLPISPDFTPCNINRVLITDKKQNLNEGCCKYFRHIEAGLHPTIN